jgi:hypothetical protein
MISKIRSEKSATYIAEYESIEQLVMVTTLPGSGISNIDIVPVTGERVLWRSTNDESFLAASVATLGYPRCYLQSIGSVANSAIRI